ncbi:expressed unknown protein [Seminavis robusta]|uniref:Uncharacterized protein n=1 Tax=Seminavis robusta TaxID=568900 RepID=A0A9N8H2Y8_9STRA|nr:expressed unknown protein [Seminavis robusta]|eukprot:Sro47_g027720.1 n/a (444) ;mRNA; r:37797-39128
MNNSMFLASTALDNVSIADVQADASLLKCPAVLEEQKTNGHGHRSSSGIDHYLANLSVPKHPALKMISDCTQSQEWTKVAPKDSLAGECPHLPETTLKRQRASFIVPHDKIKKLEIGTQETDLLTKDDDDSVEEDSIANASNLDSLMMMLSTTRHDGTNTIETPFSFPIPSTVCYVDALGDSQLTVSSEGSSSMIYSADDLVSLSSDRDGSKASVTDCSTKALAGSAVKTATKSSGSITLQDKASKVADCSMKSLAGSPVTAATKTPGSNTLQDKANKKSTEATLRCFKNGIPVGLSGLLSSSNDPFFQGREWTASSPPNATKPTVEDCKYESLKKKPEMPHSLYPSMKYAKNPALYDHTRSSAKALRRSTIPCCESSTDLQMGTWTSLAGLALSAKSSRRNSIAGCVQSSSSLLESHPSRSMMKYLYGAAIKKGIAPGHTVV